VSDGVVGMGDGVVGEGLVCNFFTMLLNTIRLYRLCKNRFLNIMQCISVQLCVS